MEISEISVVTSGRSGEALRPDCDLVTSSEVGEVGGALWQLAQNVLAPQNIDRLGTAWYRDMLNIYVRKVS